MRRSKAIGIAVALTCLGATTSSAETPARVVSMNLCTDQLAMLLAEPGQLISVSSIATDPLVSPLAHEAEEFHLNHGSAEEIFLLEPDLVVAGIWSDPATIALLRALGIRVEQFDIEDELADIPPQLERMGELLGREGEAARLITEFETALDDLLRPTTEGPRAAFYYPNGYSLGTGSFAHDVITNAGFDHISEELDRSASGTIALETLIVAAPDLVISSQRYSRPSRSEEYLEHPALLSHIAVSHGYRTGPEWICGTPAILSTIEDLAALREEIQQ